MDQETISRKPQLNKGKACFNCRCAGDLFNFKLLLTSTKCDAKKPICTPCGRFIGGGLQDCEYTETGPAQSQIIQEQISILESRIQELEQPKATRMSIGLQNPYTASRPGISDVAPGEIPSLSRIRAFFPYARQVGFFLSSQLFEALSRGTAPGDARFLSDALRSTATGLLHTHSPNTILHTIQAELLLTQYFFHNSRILEGKYHASAALSISLSSGLHKIRSADVRDSVRSVIDSLSPAATALEEGERINAFWAVFAVNNCWLAADGSPADIAYAVVDTPWPLDIGEYSENFLLIQIRTLGTLPLQSSGTIASFLANFPDRGTSPPALHAKAAIVFEQASRLAARYTENVGLRAPTAMLSAEFSMLDGVIEAFKTTLTPFESDGSQSSPSHPHPSACRDEFSSTTPSSLTSDVSCTRSRAAAMAVVALVRQTNLRDLGYVDAIMGTLWTAACQVFITELSRTQYGPSERKNIRQLGEVIETLLSAMSWRRVSGELFTNLVSELQLAAAQQNYAAAKKR
ncbi:hypothetical protein C8F04DRAFT_1150527 [Mycena alexandri]|uniref:Transcription factor domain-containing protein n=1 Tax=Mycena alexandri TaxID=1745969 RepID=A0AAD6WN41_9AGAR|nr:hypothetical protein C8F04DRAFT_1150527 [Mycena alexandri]